MNKAKGILKFKLSNLTKVYNENGEIDPTLLKLTFIILELDAPSWHKEIITEEEGLKMAASMKLKPLTCQYFKTTNYDGQPNDHFGSHGAYIENFRLNGEEYVATNSFAIGVSKDGCYEENYTDENGVERKVLKCDFYLWLDRYLNICSLIEDIWNSGIPLYSSCEYVYNKDNAEIKNDYIYPKDAIFVGHCLLGSREDGSIVEPAFEVSKMTSFNSRWDKILNEKESEIKNMKKEEWIKVLNELSHGDVKNKIYAAMSKAMTADEFYGVYLSNYNIFDNYFIYEIYVGDSYKYFKVPYTKTDTDVTIDLAAKAEVQWSEVWVEVSQVTSLNEKITQLENTITELNEKNSNLEKTNKELNEKYTNAAGNVADSASEIKVLNDKVSNLEKIAEEYNEKKNNAIVEKNRVFYQDKFLGLNAKEKFESKEIQDLINNSAKDDSAIIKLNDEIVKLSPSFNEKKDNLGGSKFFSANSKEGLKVENPVEIPEEKNEELSDFDKRFGI